MTEERLVGGYSGRLLLAISVGWAFIQAGRLVVSPLLPEISGQFGLSPTEEGLTVTTIWFVYACLQYPSGRLSDVLTRTTLLVAGLCVIAVGFLVFAGAPTYLVVLVGAVLVGFGAGLYPTPARGLVSDLYVERRGQAFGLHTASGDVGGVIAAGLAVATLAVASWRGAFLPVAVVLLSVALALHVWSREGYHVESVDLEVRATARRLLGDPGTRRLILAYALYAFTWQAATGLLPTFLRRSKSFSPAIATASFGTLFVVGAVVKPVAGGLGDRVRRDRLAPAALLLAAVALTGVVLASSELAVTVGVVVFAAGLMSYPPVMQAYLMDTFPTESMAGDLGGMRSLYIGLGSLGPTAVGFVAGRADYAVAFAGLAGCLLVAVALILTGE
ncbi:MFS transporter [Halosegnis longus]|uniref:MFS transporter n=1 Tax=Halosegnis longus TaxID=2216012 RepID=UPI000A72D0AC|nr:MULTISPECIES: MFS transporter [Halobacteriales]